MKKWLLLPVLLWPAVAWSGHGGEHAEHAVNWAELGMQFATFLMFLGVLWILLAKRVRAFYLSRHETVKKAVTEAQKAVEEANAKAKEYASKMADLDKELGQLKATFEGQAKAEKARLLEEAETAAKKVQKDAEVAIATELAKAQEQLRVEAADLAVKLAEEILRREIKPDDQKRLVDDFVKSLTQGQKQKAA